MKIFIRPLTSADVAFVSQEHVNTQPGSLLSLLGVDFLCAVYSRLLRQADFAGFIAWNGGERIGFITAGKGLARTVLALMIHNPRLLMLIFLRVLRKPVLLWHLLQTVYHLLFQGAGEDGSYELLSIGVAEKWQGKGEGTKLFRALRNELETRRISHLHVLVDVGWQGAIVFYEKQGFKPKRTLFLNGREMQVCSLELSDA